MADTGKTIGLIKALASVDPEVIQSSVEGWLDDHPEATTTVQDGSITKAKLDQNLQSTVDDVGDLKSSVDNVEDDMRDIIGSTNALDSSVANLNFASDATAFSSNNNYRSRYFPVQNGYTYTYTITSTYSPSDYRIVLSQSEPANGVSGTIIESISAGADTHSTFTKTVSYTATSDGYLSVVHYRSSTQDASVINITEQHNGQMDIVKEYLDNIADDVEDLQKSSTKKIIPTIAGGFKVADGTLVSQSSASGYYRTDYIPYSGESFDLVGIRCGYTYGAVAYYNSSKAYISGIAHVTGDITISASDVPQNTAYVLFATNDNTGYVNAILSVGGLSETLNNTILRTNEWHKVPCRMQFGAHNGAEYYAPECTIPAYRIAGQQGWQWVWIAGIHFSADGTMYVLHDDTVDRTTDGTGYISQMTDAQINALNIDQTGSGYNLSDFDPSELKIPTFEQVLQQCVKYGMKMVIRLSEFPNTYQTQEAKAVWDAFAALLKGYNVKSEDISCYLDTGTKANICRNLFGEDVEITTFNGASATAQDILDWFAVKSITGNRAGIINSQNIDLDAAKLLHTNGVRIYAYNSISPTIIPTLALYGVDICQNGRYYKLPE